MKRKLTDTTLRRLKAKEKSYVLVDGGGLYLEVRPNGRVYWFHRYTLEGKREKILLGEYPYKSLTEARVDHEEARDLLRQGISPRVAREAEAEAERLAKEAEQEAPTVAWLIDQYIQRWAKRRKRTWEDDRRQLDKDVRPRWGARKAAEVTRKDVVSLLDDVVERGSPIAANRLLACVRRMFNWAVEVGILESTPCYRVRAPAKENQKDRVLTEDEIRTAWKAWEDGGATEDTRRALQFLLATVQRSGEVQGCHWKEIDGIWWTIPAERAKNGQAHRVPLSDLALEILGQPGKGFVFRGRDGGPMSDKALSRATARHAKLEPEPIKSRGKGKRKWTKPQVVWGVDRFSPHDLRRTAASHMTGMGVSRLVVSKILNHVETGVTAVYDRHSYDQEKRQALESWARKLRQIVEGEPVSNLVEFPLAIGTE